MPSTHSEGQLRAGIPGRCNQARLQDEERVFETIACIRNYDFFEGFATRKHNAKIPRGKAFQLDVKPFRPARVFHATSLIDHYPQTFRHDFGCLAITPLKLAKVV